MKLRQVLHGVACLYSVKLLNTDHVECISFQQQQIQLTITIILQS